MWESLVIRMVIGIIVSCIKNPDKKAKLKQSLLQIRDSINELYPGE